MICKNCENFIPIKGDNDKDGLCSMPESYFPTTQDTKCVYLETKPLTCANCLHYIFNDTGCMTVEENDPICTGFEDALEADFSDILFEWAKRGSYNREKIAKLCDEFENSKWYSFVLKHGKSETSAEKREGATKKSVQT